jgi:hypothetical protein
VALSATDRAAQAGGSGAVAQDGKKKKKKNRGNEKPHSAALVVAESNAHGHRGVTAAHALCIPTVTIVPQNAARSSTSRNMSARGASSLPGMAPHLVADPARKRPMTKRWPRPNRTSGISHPRGS